MKYQLVTALYCLILIIFFKNSSYAHSSIMDNKIIYSNEINHKIVQAFTSNSDTSKLNKYEISKKAQKHFNMLYKNGNPAWQKLGKNFLASLEQDGRYIKALFAPNGFLIYHISSGSEKHLPFEVRKLIKSTYFDYIIGTVNEVTTENKTAWVVNLQDSKDLIIVKVVEDAMEKVDHYSLSK